MLATAGNNRLGGDDFDQRLIDYIASDFLRNNGIDLRKDKMALQRLKEAAEKAKIELSGMTQSNVNIPFITQGAAGPLHLDCTITRAKFNELTADLVDKTRVCVQKAMADAGLSNPHGAALIRVARHPDDAEHVENYQAHYHDGECLLRFGRPKLG